MLSTSLRNGCLAWVLLLVSAVGPAGLAVAQTYNTSGFQVNPYDWQVDRKIQMLASQDARIRAEAIENLSFLRAYRATRHLSPLLEKDPDAQVRREAAVFLGLCGSRGDLSALIQALSDADWSVRQAAWVALTNLTGQEIPFDALADESDQARARKAWLDWVFGALGADGVPEKVRALIPEAPPETEEQYLRAEKGARAWAVFAEPGQAGPLPALLEPYLDDTRLEPVQSGHHRGDSLKSGTYAERLYVQACIRSLGRVGGEQAWKTLWKLLENPQLAPYAADALGDIGTPKTALKLIEAFKDYAITSSGRMNWRPDTRYNGVVPKFHTDDYARFTATDRIPRTAYAIAHGLVRCEIEQGREVKEQLRRIAPELIATLASMHDATIFYEQEPYPMMVAYLLEQADLRQGVVDLFLAENGVDRAVAEDLPHREVLTKLANFGGHRRWWSVVLPALAASKDDIPAMVSLLDHNHNFVRISAAKALIVLDARSAAGEIYTRLKALPDDVEQGYAAGFQTEEFNVESGRYKEGYVRALGALGSSRQHVELLWRLCSSERNNLDIRHAAALALAEMGTAPALEALKQIDRDNEYHSIKVIAREAVFRAGLSPAPLEIPASPAPLGPTGTPPQSPEDVRALVFLSGEPNPGNMFSIPNTMQGYTTTDAGPTTRLGRNVYKLSPAEPGGSLTQLTHFEDGYVADLEVSFDGSKLIFCRREKDDPWWHIYEINADGSDLRQITDGPYHDVQPNYLGDGRIVFSTSRIGTRDEYHGYLCTGLAVCNPDGSDLHCIGFNLGRDAEPVVDDTGRILFTRLELFYSRMKTEWNLLATQTDGTGTMTLYGPERRDFWRGIGGSTSLSPPRHRVLRIAMPQPLDGRRYLINSFEGPMIVGPGRYEERMLQPENSMAVTTPYPIGRKTLLVSAGLRPWKTKKGKLDLDRSGNKQRDINAPVDHGLYWMDRETGELTKIFDRPGTSEFEARPLAPREVPPVIPESPMARSAGYTARLYCQSVFNTQHEYVKQRGKYIRIAEALPTIQRHATHRGGTVWKNHGGATGRVWATLPLAADGSFHMEIPADRMFHLQVLDSDRRVVGNELIWHYARPGESKGCFGCHDNPNRTPPRIERFPAATQQSPIQALPRGEDLRYRAKMWFKGTAPWSREERMRTVNAVNLLGRF